MGRMEDDMKYYIPFGLKDLIYGILKWDLRNEFLYQNVKKY